MKKLILLGGLILFFSCSSNQVVEDLFNNARDISEKKFTRDQLKGLPEPVQKYFHYALTDGQPYVSYLRLKHDGVFKTDPKKDFIDIKGEQYFIGEKPGFVWIGKTKLFKAVDTYVNDKGRLKVYLFSLFPIVNQEGKKIDQGELLRWLGERVWLHTNLLTYEYGNFEVFYDMIFNKRGQITSMTTQRYMGTDSIEKWHGQVSDYIEVNGMHIPARIQGIWQLDSGDYKYADFKVTEFEFGVDEKF